MDNRPIGVFDSGLGGLTAVKELEKVLPQESLVYFGGHRPGALRLPQPGDRPALRQAGHGLPHGTRGQGGAGGLRHGQLHRPGHRREPGGALLRRGAPHRPGRCRRHPEQKGGGHRHQRHHSQRLLPGRPALHRLQAPGVLPALPPVRPPGGERLYLPPGRGDPAGGGAVPGPPCGSPGWTP